MLNIATRSDACSTMTDEEVSSAGGDDGCEGLTRLSRQWTS
jgi:hypothetical protein